MDDEEVGNNGSEQYDVDAAVTPDSQHGPGGPSTSAGIATPQVVGGGSSGTRRRGGFPRKLKDMVPKARGAPGGPLRTPLHIGDKWQHQQVYEIEKVFSLFCRYTWC